MCNLTSVRTQAAKYAPGYKDGWMPELPCGRDDLQRDDPCSFLAPSATRIPTALLTGARLYADRRAALLSEVKRNGHIVEVGYASGVLSRWMMVNLHPVVQYALDLKQVIKGCRAKTTSLALRDNHTTMHCVGGDSSTNLGELPDGQFDLMYIDADHNYKCASRAHTDNHTRVAPLCTRRLYQLSPPPQQLSALMRHFCAPRCCVGKGRGKRGTKTPYVSTYAPVSHSHTTAVVLPVS